MTDLALEIRDAADSVYRSFTDFVDRGDVEQEVHLYALGKGRRHLERAAETDDSARIRSLLTSAARLYCEQEKATASGYQFDDIAWYSPHKLAALVPLAQADDWDGITGESGDPGMPSAHGSAKEGGGLMAMVMDVRRVIRHVAGPFDPDTEEGMAGLERLAEMLGGEYPNAPGYTRDRRQVVSNAQALAITTHTYEEAA